MSYASTVERLFPHTPMARTGSREICSPAPIGTDEDWIVLVTDLGAAISILDGAGFTTTTDQGYQGMKSPFQSWKRGDLNILITDEATFFEEFNAATAVAKRLNLQDKSDRIALFRAVLYGESCQMREAA